MAVFLGLILFTYIVVIILNRKKVDLLNPSVIFTLLILATYFVSSLRLSLLQSEYPIWFTLLLFCMIIMFYLGDKTASLFKLPKTIKTPAYSKTTMSIVLFVLWLAIVVSFLMMVRLLGAPPAISKIDRAEYFVSGWGTVVILQSSFFGLLLYDRYNKNSAKSLFWLYFPSILIIALLLSNKFQLIYMLVLFLVAYNTYKKRISVGTLLKASGIIVLLFILLFEFVYKEMYGVSLWAMYDGYKIILPDSLKFLTQPYLYVAFNYENLYQFLTHETHHLYGLKTFGPILEIFQLQQFYPENIVSYLGEWQNLLKVKSMTTGTMFEDFAQDGGITWMFVLTYLSGAWSGISYKLFKRNQNFANFFMYSATTVAIFMAFFSNVFTSKVTIINLVVAFLISLALRVHLVFGRKRW